MTSDLLARSQKELIYIGAPRLTAEGDPALHYVRGGQLFAGQEGEGLLANPTVGGTHPGDVGEYDMADFYAAFLPTIVGR
jgi:hypothetical protein